MDSARHCSRPALALAADFTGGGNYVQMGRRIDPVDVDSLSLWVKAPKGADCFTLRLIDGTGQCHPWAILNEDDGEGRIGFSGWFSGPHSKDLDHVGDLILE